MPDTPFWQHTPSAGDTAPQTPADALPTKPGGISAIARRGAERRKKDRARADHQLTDEVLIATAAASIPWEAIARRHAEQYATTERFIYRQAQRIAGVLKRAGLPFARAEDLQTPEAQAALEQAEENGDIPHVADDPGALDALIATFEDMILGELKQSEARKQHAARLLLIEGWGAIASNLRASGSDRPSAITAALRVRLDEPGGWAWLATHHLDLAAVLQDDKGATQAPFSIPAFNGDGIARVLSGGVMHHLWRGIVEPSDWQHDDTGRPVRVFDGRGAQGFLRTKHVNAAAAWDAVKRLGDVPADVFIIVVAKMMANSSRPSLWDDGAVYIGRDELTGYRGKRKHKRAYKPEDSRETVEAVQALECLYTRGIRDSYEKRHGKVKVPFEGRVILVKDTTPRLLAPDHVSPFLAGEGGPLTDPKDIAGWHIELGSWAGDLRAESLAFAPIMQRLLTYPKAHGRSMRRLGFALAFAFRIRAQEQNWRQPYRIGDLLRDAALTVDARNPGRTVDRVHEALIELQRDEIIGEARYVTAPDDDPLAIASDHTKGWVARWLEQGIIITPSPKTTAAYQALRAKTAPTSRALTTRKREKTAPTAP